MGRIIVRIDEMPRSENIEDRRGAGMGRGGFNIPGRRGGLGIGTIIVVGLIGYWLGIDPRLLIGGAEMLSAGGSSQQEPGSVADQTRTGAPSDQMGQFVSAVLGGTEAQWQKIFAQYGKSYEPPKFENRTDNIATAGDYVEHHLGHHNRFHRWLDRSLAVAGAE
jgi:hypothetical protein